MESSGAVVREMFARFASGDRRGAASLFHPAAVFSYRAAGVLCGEYRGREEIQRFWSEQDHRAGGQFSPTLLDTAEGAGRVFLLVRYGTPNHSWRRVVVFEVVEGLISGAEVFEGDPSVAAAFFSSPAREP